MVHLAGDYAWHQLTQVDCDLDRGRRVCFGYSSTRFHSLLPQVRAISRRQFYTRSLGNKVAVAQKSAPPPQPQPVLPSSVPRSLSMGRAVVLPQGDR